jgi:hypothetical protein
MVRNQGKKKGKGKRKRQQRRSIRLMDQRIQRFRNYGIRRRQRGGAIGAGMAIGMMAPMLLGTLGKILKVNVGGGGGGGVNK